MNLNRWQSSGTNNMPVMLTLISPSEITISTDLSSVESNSEIFSESYMLTLASEHALAKDWNTPEEDEAWATL